MSIVGVPSGTADVNKSDYKEAGYLEICKQVPSSPTPPNQFVFNVDGQTVDVPPNACSPAVEVTSGTEVVTETPVSPYQMAGCSTIPTACLVSCNPSGNTATVSIDSGGAPNETILTVSNNVVATSGCSSGTGTASTVTTTTPAASTIALGSSNVDTATVSGSISRVDPTGTVCFHVCGPLPAPAACTSQVNQVGSFVAVTAGAGDTATATSASFTPPSAGFWCFAGYYSGDSNYSSSADTSTDECFNVP
jgi:hypothetical protein